MDLGLLTLDLANLRAWAHNPLLWVGVAFQIWMLVDAIRREEWIWAALIFFFSFLTALFYFFLVYRAAPVRPTRGFELPGAYDRRRIRELQAQIHHLDKAHHHSELGNIYFQQGKLQQAEQLYRAALERDADDLDTLAHLGQCLLRQHREVEARPLLEKVCADDPQHDYGHSLMALAETQGALGDEAAAVASWRRVLEAHSYARARVQLAELLLKRNEVAAAKAALEEVLSDDQFAPRFQRDKEKVWVRKARGLLRQAG